MEQESTWKKVEEVLTSVEISSSSFSAPEGFGVLVKNLQSIIEKRDQSISDIECE